MPSDFAAALDSHPEARRFFDALTHSQRRAFVDPIEGAMKPETRARRIDRAVVVYSRSPATSRDCE